MAKAKKTIRQPATAKKTVQKRSLNVGQAKLSHGAPSQEQDPKRRLGDFTSAGEHARVGGRGRIVGQTKQKFSTDKRS